MIKELQAFNAPQLSVGGDTVLMYGSVSEEVLGTLITKAEMAEALGMLENDLFVERIFACMAKENPNRVTFREFLNVVAKFARGIVRLLFASMHGYSLDWDNEMDGWRRYHGSTTQELNSQFYLVKSLVYLWKKSTMTMVPLPAIHFHYSLNYSLKPSIIH